MRKLVALAVALLVVTVVTAGAFAATRTTHASSVTVSAKKVDGLGKVLVTSKGLTLYMFVPDKQKKVTCVKTCAAIWPPLKAAKGAKLVALGGVKHSLLGTDKDPSGGLVVTYDKWPLYTYVADRKPGQASGQRLNSAGGLWYVLAVSGKVVKTKVK
ncbi:MAG: COG4315 family predicted lipoprotein [Solirubrobacteraceae bacterium]